MTKKRLVGVWVTAAAVCSCLAVTPVVVPESVAVSQDAGTHVVSVTYDLAGVCGIVTLDILTNGVSIGAVNFTNVTGDVNRKVEPGTGRRITWRPYETWSGRRFETGALSVNVTAWATNAPPPYRVVDLKNPAPEHHRYYASAEAVPLGVTNHVYKTDKLVMRRIFATGILWRMGDADVDQVMTSDKNGNMVPLCADDVSRFVVLTNDFYMGIYPVTQGQWELAYSNYGASGRNKAPSVYQGEDRAVHPVENVPWSRIRGDGDGENVYNWPANGYAVNSSYFLGKLRAYTKIMFDFPTEAQWEFACRAGTTGTNNVDGVSLDETAWHSGLTVTSQEVGLKRPNAWGLYDMLGNVEEWVLDRRGTKPVPADGTPVVEPVGTTATSGNRIRKGGGFLRNIDTDAYWCRPGMTSTGWSQNAENQCLGFRLWSPAVAP